MLVAVEAAAPAELLELLCAAAAQHRAGGVGEADTTGATATLLLLQQLQAGHCAQVYLKYIFSSRYGSQIRYMPGVACCMLLQVQV